MTNKKTLFPAAAFIGFDNMLKQLDNLAQHATDNYPPHNIVKESEEDFIIELAVAGFEESEIDLELKDRTITVKGDHVCKNRDIVYRGISTKRFSKQFRLSEYVQVNGASLKDGILSVYLKVVLPDDARPRKININEDKQNDKNN